jgi:hypothetical protein
MGGIRYRTVPENWLSRLTDAVEDWREPLTIAAEATADAIIETTLKGIGENDQPFAPYSASYAEFLERTGAKPTSPVNLRGVISSKRGRGNKIKLRKNNDGIIDVESEMSRDLITVIITSENRVRLVYKARKSEHMKYHLDGAGNLPQRKWFSIKKTEVRETAFAQLRDEWHNRTENLSGRR